MTKQFKQVEIEITAKVKTSVTVYDNESLDDLQNRDVDIYLHGAGEHGYMNKKDLGANEWKITVVDTDTETDQIVNTGLWFLKKELPPIGTVCEYQWSKGNWYKAEIVMHDNGYAVFRTPEASIAKHQSSCVTADFRPLRTAREWAIQEMSRVFHNASNGAIDDAAFGALYDHGYLKQ
jgi:hypothetical protein